MEFFREERVRGVRHLAGNRYSRNAARKVTYINLISLYVNIVSRNLISKNPRVSLSTFDKSNKPSVDAAESWINQELVRMDFASTMQRIVLDALFSVGIGKVCLATPEDAAVSGWGLQAGRPYISRVDLDDFVFDVRARDFSECTFLGHRYRAPLDVVRENPHFNKKARDRLKPSQEIQYNREGDERIFSIGRDFLGYDEDLYDMVDLWEFYLPREKLIKTFTEDDLSGPSSAWDGGEPIALGEKPWIGHDSGPYPILAFGIVPGNIFPKGPVLDLIDLHEGHNESYRKLMRQAANLKVVTACSRNNPEDGEALRTAKDQDSVPLFDPKAVSQVVQGGPHAGLWQWARSVSEDFMRMGGNLLTMGGLAPQAGTLGQEELLAQQSNGQVASMQDATAAFVTKCADCMLWYQWHDPELVMRAKMNDPNLPDLDTVREVHPWTAPSHLPDPRTGQMRPTMRRTASKPDIKIDPYSMRHATPQQKAKDLMSFLTQLYVPLAQLFQQQGIALDLNAFTGIFAKLIDSPDLQSVFSVQTPPPGTGNSPAGDSGPRNPSSTSREYVRKDVGRGGAREDGMKMDNALAAMAAGGEQMNGTPRNMIGQ